jgi:hypothetical protein
MKLINLFIAGAAGLLFTATVALGEVKIVVDHNDNEHASAAFKFKTVPPPSKSDTATKAKFSIVDGDRDENGGDVDKLNDGKGPTEEDQPSENFFFNAGTEGGRLAADLGSVIEVKQVNTYSWHPNTRGPQVYKLYASDGQAEGFKARPQNGTDPEKAGWKLVAKVDTRPKEGDPGGQYGVSVSESEGSLGKFRYLLFDAARTEADDDFGNTFYSEIDVIAKDEATGTAASAANAPGAPFIIRSTDDYCEISIDTAGAPDLTDWAEKKLAPVLAEWYPSRSSRATAWPRPAGRGSPPTRRG